MNRKDALNTSIDERRSRVRRRAFAAQVEKQMKTIRPEAELDKSTRRGEKLTGYRESGHSPIDARVLWRRYKRLHIDRPRDEQAFESLAEAAAQAGQPELETRCLEHLAFVRARGDWTADNRRPLPGGAYSNLRKA